MWIINKIGSWCFNILAVWINSLFTSPIAFLTWGWVSKFSTTSGLKKRCHYPPLLTAPFHGEFFSGFPALLADDKGQGSRASWKSVKTITATHPPAYFPTLPLVQVSTLFYALPLPPLSLPTDPGFHPPLRQCTCARNKACKITLCCQTERKKIWCWKSSVYLYDYTPKHELFSFVYW